MPRYRYGVLLPGYTVLSISAAVLAGSVFKPEFFQHFFSSFGEIKPNTAVGFLLLSIALLLLDSPRWPFRAMSRGCAFCAALIGSLTGLEFLAGLNPGIDHLLFANPWHVGDLHVGRMYPVIAINLVMLGTALLLINVCWGRFSPSPILTWITAVLSFLTLTGYVYDPIGLYRLRMFSGVSLPALLVCLLLCVAIMFARPERGVAAILLSRQLGGQAARRLLPAAIFVPFTVSLLIFRLHQAGTYGSALMVFLFVVAPVLIFVPLILLSATLLNRIGRERQRSEDELRFSTERFSSVVASAMDAIITLDESQRVIVFNEAAEKMFGCPSWDVLGKPLDRFLPKQFREIHSAHIRDFGEGAVTTRTMAAPGILTAVRADGEQFSIEATVSQVQVAGKKLYTVILRDITERLRAEETLRHSEARFRSIYEQAGVGIGQVAFNGQLLMVNPALCRMLGYEEAELRGRKIQEIIHPDDQVREAELIGAMLREHRKSYQIEKRYLHRDGSAVWVDVFSSMVNGSAGQPLYRISVVQNVTERKRAEEQLKQAQKMEAIGRLAGGVAHDFNTLLNVMLGYSELLLAELPPSDARRERVMQIKNSGDAAALLTRQLLAFSRKQAIAQEVIDLREVASKITPILARLLRDDIVLTVKCSDEPCPVKVDPGQIQQLVLNLIANAGDAMPHGGQVNIEVRAVELDETYVQQHPTVQAGRHVMFSISDTGTGMDAETVSHIFEPFFTTKEVGKGTGLGLATVYGIAKRNGGDIWVYSEPGVGTIFKVYLPLTGEALQNPEATKIVSRGAGGGGETILLVEDSAALRELTSVILRRDGYHILEAEDGIAALEVSASFQGKIHLVLTDVVMPRMRGPQLAEQILKLRPEIAVVFLSGYTEEAITQSDGITGFTLVEKPYTAEVLLNSIRRALENSLSRSTLKIQ
jgi:two-component system, cell cycle sensor histidine kinase and response regulator CckA